MYKIMAVYGDGHPDTVVDLVSDEDETFIVLDRWKEYMENGINGEFYIGFYSEEL